MLSTAGGIVSGVNIGLYLLAALIPLYGRRKEIASWCTEATTAEQDPVEARVALGCRVCSGLIRRIQMGDVTGPKANRHLVNGFVCDAGQFEGQQMAHHVIA